MKRYGNLYPQICDMNNIIMAHKNARRGKRHYPAVVKVEHRSDYYFEKLHETLINNEFENSPYEAFYKIGHKKNRWIYKLPYFPDRIVHHCIVQVVEPIWLKVFVRDTHSTIKGKGIHDGLKRMKKFLRDVPGTKYCLKMDVEKFYPSVNHDILKDILLRKIKCKPTMNILENIINSSDGVPIGNYLSQHFGNLYLSYYDHWMKEEQKVKYYSRYCDDIVVLGDDKSRLHDLFHETKEYMHDRLNLKIKHGTRVFPVEKGGVDYLGYVFFHNHIRVRKSIVEMFKAKIKRIKKCYLWIPSSEVINTVMSYYGWMKHANARKLWLKYIDRDVVRIMQYVCHKNQIKLPGPIRSMT